MIIMVEFRGSQLFFALVDVSMEASEDFDQAEPRT